MVPVIRRTLARWLGVAPQCPALRQLGDRHSQETARIRANHVATLRELQAEYVAGMGRIVAACQPDDGSVTND